MPAMSAFWLRCATVLYAVGLIDAIIGVLRRRLTPFPGAIAAFTAGALLHFVAIVELSVAYHHIAANNFFETTSICAFLLAVIFLFVQWRYQFAGLRIFLFPLVFILTLIGALGNPVATWTDTRVRGAWLVTHILLILVGYAALLLSAGAAVFYLLQEQRLKSRKTGGGFWAKFTPGALPPLETLDSLVTRSMSIGFVAITLAIVAGSTWASIESGTRWIREPKIAISLVTWGFYLLMIFLRLSAGWRGRKAAVLALTVLGFAALTWAAHVGLRPLIEK
jgi:ABC-type transport system involved in cytochrome c biogenesis permease subunit